MKLSFTNFLILSASCIASIANAQDKIVGGTEVNPGRYAYQAALVDGSGSQFCGGSLIAPGYVLSAAHCAGIGSAVQIGRHDLSDSSEDFENINVVTEITHPDYDDDTLENDIMILKLESDSSAQPVEYDTGSADTSAGEDVTVMGWGTTQSGGSSSDVLLEVEVDIVSNSDCESDYGSGAITDVMMCAARDGKDSCQGDSGGPLVIVGSDAATDVQVGIVSWGNGCADPSFPGVYARVSEFTDFIECVLSGGTDECGNTGLGGGDDDWWGDWDDDNATWGDDSWGFDDDKNNTDDWDDDYGFGGGIIDVIIDLIYAIIELLSSLSRK